MNVPTTVNVQLAERSYPIHIGRGISPSIAEMLATVLPQVNHAVVITDENVKPLSETISVELRSQNIRLTELFVPSGETSKSVGEIERLWTAMLADHTDRGSAVIAIGGGVVGDLGGFAAASFARGIPLVQVPTTLLSQVDSSVGGKTGINLPGTKNIVGAFWQPPLVVVDTSSLETLPHREFVSGLAEVAKYGVIMDPVFFGYLEQHAAAVVAKEEDAITHVVAQSCRCKATVVAEDERETSGRRAILNYGHTFAHAIESTAGYGKLLHGEAVSIGMHMAATLATKLGRVDQNFVQRQRLLLEQLELPLLFGDSPAEQMWQAMQHDKKVQHGKLRFVLPSKIGHVELVPDVPKSLVLETLQSCR